MKKLFFLLLCLLLASSAGFAQSKDHKPRVKPKRVFSHTSESDKGKTSKAHFRPVNNIRPTIDLNPRSLEKFKTAKANKNYKFSNGKGFK